MRSPLLFTLLISFWTTTCDANPLLDRDFSAGDAMRAVAAPSTPPVERIAALVALAQYYGPHYPSRGLDYARQAISAQSLLSDQEQTGEPYIALAECYHRIGRIDSMEDALADAASFDRDFASQRFKAVLALDQAAYLVEINKLDSAERGPLRVADYLSSSPDITNKRYLITTHISYRRGDFVRAMQAATNGHLGYWEDNDSLGICETHNSIGIVLASIGFHNDALNEFDFALRAISLMGDSSLLRGCILSNKANVLRHLKRPNDAERCLNEAARIAKLHTASGLLLATYNNLGEIHSDQKEFTTAIQCYQKALSALPMNDRSLERAILEFNVQKNALEIMYSKLAPGQAHWPKKDSILVSGQWFHLQECIDLCGEIHSWLQNAPYRDFDVEVALCLNRAFQLAGEPDRTTPVWIEAKVVTKEEVNATIQVFDNWRDSMVTRTKQRHFIEDLRSISLKGLLLPFFALLFIYIIGRSPGEGTVAALFVIFGLLTTAWIEMLLHHWFTAVAGTTEGLYWILCIVVALISLGLHVIGHKVYKKVLDRRRTKLNEQRQSEPKSAVQPAPSSPPIIGPDGGTAFSIIHRGPEQASGSMV